MRVGLDTHVALLGEAAFGALRGTRDAVYVTVSTGVGGAILAGGRLVTGADGLAGEIGHLPVMAGGPRCGCGARGHLEAVASGPAIAAAGEEAARAGRSEALAAPAWRRRRTGGSRAGTWPRRRPPETRPPRRSSPGRSDALARASSVSWTS